MQHKNKDKTYQEIIEKFFSSEHMGEYSLEKIQKACDYFGHPEMLFRSIHIAGTNGKGSVARMVFQILKESGKKVGVYTSPHLIDIRERFETEIGCISQSKFIFYAQDILQYGEKLSYFEKCVLLAFLYFRDQGCEYAVIEVGLGGRLDATNIIHPILSIITSIGYDHMEYLGNTLEKISFEKAGIIKENIPVVLYGKNEVIEKIAHTKKAHIIFPHKREVYTNLLGEHQLSNAQIAYEAGRVLGVPEKIIQTSLSHVSHKGRLQYVRENILLDGAHNRDGLEALKLFLDTQSYKWQQIIYCFALKKGKSVEIIFDTFSEVTSWCILNHHSNLLEDISCLQQEGEKKGKYMQILGKDEIYQNAKKYPQKIFVIFGSLYCFGDFLEEDTFSCALPESV